MRVDLCCAQAAGPELIVMSDPFMSNLESLIVAPPFFSAWAASLFSPLTQLANASSVVMAPDLGSSGLVHL